MSNMNKDTNTPTPPRVFGEGGGPGEGTPFCKKGSPPPESSLLSIGSLALVGARGGMGKLIVGRCREAGLTVRELDRPLTDEKIAEGVAGADMVLVSVPVYATGEVAEKVAARMGGRQILADVGSVKTQPINDMVAQYHGPVVGTHPLFGPAPGPDDALRVAVMDGRPGEDVWATRAVADWCRRIGFTPFASDAEEHDRAAAYVQGLNFVTTLAYLAAQGAGGAVQKYLTPSFTRRLVAAEKLITKDAGLFTALYEANPYSHEAVRNFRSFLNLAAGGDVDLLVRRAEAWWTAETAKKDNP
ncbi:Prephenate dehydrogenase [Solidesulfovibrio fructosivorans JJ]]|uniref:Prephenate dehydrogenase n=1 Tax=Solidesulfovibrio fructosivorans JJ] TaxID=596151 RepID=E1JYH6_SOLFR|nr:prephenate dehydrogenase [Solidesulfovibrio fructosivorans]EFL50560.1 Prephenate dehydrogenase [Solidesulfovibrio fructosivorans JJ]]